MDIPLNARVVCSDGEAGHITDILVNPDTKTVTHVVVRTSGIFGYDVVVAIADVIDTTPEQVRVRLSRHALEMLPPFQENDDIRPKLDTTAIEFLGDATLVWPYAETLVPPHENIPPGAVAVRRGDRVAARDGHIGHVDGFLADPRDNHITHLVLRKGHLWGTREVTIPVAQIERIEDGAIMLKLDKAQVGALPSVPIH